MNDVHDGAMPRRRLKSNRSRLDRLSTGLILLWLGMVFLFGLGWSVALIGVGVTLIVEQIAARRLAGRIDGFYATAGAFALLFGLAGLLGLAIPFPAVGLMVLGLAIAGSAFARGSRR